ncbi:MAG: hypothetical protein GYA24_22090 [Candidatus Lokiarchaeota archaeon]|nr:hypothetical protein [Candidatus Lokiarchaeota archaeon]
MVEGPRRIVGTRKILYKDEYLESGYEAKDRNNLEVSFDYLLHKGEARDEYTITGYIFVPPELKINKATYSKQTFFHDFQSSIRFQTPHFPLRSVVNNENGLSPLNRIKKILDEMAGGKFDDEDLNARLVYELKMHAQIVRSNLKNEIAVIIEMCSNKGSCSPENVIETTQPLVGIINQIQDRFHSFQATFNSLQLPQKTKETYFAADEYVSYYIEHYATVLLDKIKNDACYDLIIPDIRALIIRRQQRRKNMNYTLVLDPDVTDATKNSKNTKVHYWKSFLKHFIKQVLVLETKEREERKLLMQVIGTAGAITAMSVFVIFTFFFFGFGQYSLPFVLATLIFYAIKDRIKVLFLALGERITNKMIPDKVYDIVDSLKKKEKIGTVKESVQFIKLDKVPDEVIQMRNNDRASVIEMESSEENVLLYRKHIQLDTGRITHLHERHKNITDALKINIKNFLSYAWDPEENILYFNAATGRLEEIPVPIRYHINMVLSQSYTDSKNVEKTRYKRIRVVFEKDGIDNVEDIPV